MAQGFVTSRRTRQQGPAGILRRMAAALERYQARIPCSDLQLIVESLPLTLADVAAYRTFREDCYSRNLIHRTSHYEMLCLCWRSGQRSAIHDHSGSSCTVRVLQGLMTNIEYELLPSGLVKPLRTTQIGPGSVDARADDDIHEIGNLEPLGNDLVTLHVYSPPLRGMNVFKTESNHPQAIPKAA